MAGCSAGTAGPFAPENLAATLPRQVNGLNLHVTNSDFESFYRYVGESDGEKFRAFLLDRDKSPTDVLVAGSLALPIGSSTGPTAFLRVNAVRVRGMYAEELQTGLMDTYALPARSLDLGRLGGKEAWIDEGEQMTVAYPNGEVLYIVEADERADAEAALTALP
jgi:hypothetical protein